MMRYVFSAVFGLLFFICNVCFAYAPEGKLYVTMIDIGQGDCFLIETAEQNILIDTGDTDRATELVAMLQDNGIERFDRIILTHPHADHIGGVKMIADNFQVDVISDNGFASNSPLYKKYHDLPVTFATLRAGDVISFGAGAKFKVFYPTDKPLRSVNNQSIVGKLTFGDFSMLFTGDIERGAEDELYNRYGTELRSVVLKAPHHASRTSSSADFINVVAPDYVFISAGRGNSFGHPHKQSLRTYRYNSVAPEKILCTRFNGTARIETDGKNHLIFVERVNDWLEEYMRERIDVSLIG